MDTVPKSEDPDDAAADPNAFDMTRSLGVDVDDFFPVRPVRLEQKVLEDGKLVVANPAQSLSGTSAPQGPINYVSEEELIERKRAVKDHETIAREFNIDNSKSTEARPEIEQKLFFFQMPVVRPQFETAGNAKLPSPTVYPEGMAGKLRLHKSGKLTMLLGDVVMEVSQGAEAGYLQDVVALNPANQQAHLIGQVSRKMVVSPDVDALLS